MPAIRKSDRINRVTAVVSGKGGSGKTMITATLAEILSFSGIETVLVDGDIGTAGMTYYLGLNLVANTTVGLADLVLKEGTDLSGLLQPLKRFGGRVTFLGVGDHKRLLRKATEISREFWSRLVSSLRQLDCPILIDCRGGIDSESLAVCSAADDILLVVETDTTSFQATQHLVEVLSERDLGFKIRGFIINKVFDNPSYIARNGTAVFHCQFLGAVPFDLSATRSFLAGELPPFSSLFTMHVWRAANALYPDMVGKPPGRVWDFEDFRRVSLSDPSSNLGGVAAVMGILSLVLASWTRYGDLLEHSSQLPLMVASIAIIGLLGSLEPTRRALGRVIQFYQDGMRGVVKLLRNFLILRRF